MKTKLKELQKLLSNEPSKKTWDALLKFFREWPEGNEKEEAVQYADLQMEHWPNHLRIFGGVTREHTIRPLVRRLEISSTKASYLEKVASYPHITELVISGSKTLKDLSGMEAFTHLTTLHLKDCRQLKTLDGIESLRNLKVLRLNELRSLEDLESLTELPNLTTIEIFTSLIKGLDSLGSMPNLQLIYIDEFTYFESYKIWANVKNITTLHLREGGFPSWFMDDWGEHLPENYQNATIPPNLTTLRLYDFDIDYEFVNFINLSKLTTLELYDCACKHYVFDGKDSGLLSVFKGQTSIETCRFHECVLDSKDLLNFAKQTNITTLELTCCGPNIPLDELKKLPNLTKLQVS